MAEANPNEKIQPEKEFHSTEAVVGSNLDSVMGEMQFRSKLAHRSINQATIFLYGKSGDGKSSTLNYLFDAELIPAGSKKSVTRNVTEYGCTVRDSQWFKKGLKIGFIDTPGFDDTEGEDADAENLAKISHFVATHPEMGEAPQFEYVYPNIVLIVVSALDNRLEGIYSKFSKMLHVLTRLNVVDSFRPNILIVVTHAMHLGVDYNKDTKDIERIFKFLTRAHLSIEVPVIFIENLDQKEEMKIEGDWKILPDGKRQPLNVFEAMINLMGQSGDQVGVEAIRLLFSGSRKCKVEKIMSTPEHINVSRHCDKWLRIIKDKFFCKKENTIYSFLKKEISSDDIQIFPLAYNLQKNNIVNPSDLKHKNLMDLKKKLIPFEFTQDELGWLTNLFKVALIELKPDFKLLGLGYSRQFQDIRKQVLDIPPLKSDEVGIYTIHIPKSCVVKDLRQITINIQYDENAKWLLMKYLKLTFRVCYVLFQVDIDKLEEFELNTVFISNLEKSLPQGKDPDNLEYKFENQNFANFIKDYALHCTTGLYFGGYIEGDLYFDRRKDENSNRKFLAENAAELSTQLESYFTCLRNGTILRHSQPNEDIYQKLKNCNLIWSGKKELNAKTILEVNVNKWNNWINHIENKPICLDSMVNSVSLQNVLTESRSEKIRSYAREFKQITTGKEADLNDLRFVSTLSIPAGAENDCDIRKEDKILTRIEASNRAESNCNIL